jgi:hypothetical protein
MRRVPRDLKTIILLTLTVAQEINKYYVVFFADREVTTNIRTAATNKIAQNPSAALFIWCSFARGTGAAGALVLVAVWSEFKSTVVSCELPSDTP